MKALLSIVGIIMPLALTAQEVNDSIDTFNNQNVSTQITVQGRDELTMQNDTITSTGYLKASSPQGILITGSFTVALGGQLELNGGRQYLISFFYDSTGNRIRREKTE